MPQSRIYRPSQDTLSNLLDQAVSGEGATLLIPDLQRPFRWSPAQVIRLIDSLMRGWPFGTLLLWVVQDQDIADVPARTFWRQFDGVSPDEGQSAGRMDPPYKRGYRMVLDGQQRLQSLVLALSGEASLRLRDVEWRRALETERVKGKASQYWSVGALCLDLEEYARQRADKKVRVSHVDYTRALRWVVCAAQDGRGPRGAPKTYDYPLPLLSENPGRFIRVSRLWQLTAKGESMSEIDEQLGSELLHDVRPELASQLRMKLLELVMALGEVRRTDVSFLELLPIPKEGFDDGQYDDAIVNIFTRLNSAGSALSEEEITFAWIKRCWIRASEEAPEATEAFEQLNAALREQGLTFGMDKLVVAVSTLWAIVERQGALLRPADLLKGTILRPMAEAISTGWAQLSGSLLETARVLREAGLEHREQYDSLNAFISLAAWRFVAEQWIARERPTHMEAHHVRARMEALLREHAARFLILSGWAGRWSDSGGSALGKYASVLSEDVGLSRKEKGPALLERLEARLSGWIKECVPDAQAHIEGLKADQRGDVRRYYVPLWVWHRLTPERRRHSRLLNSKRTAKASLDVDHIVSFMSWERRRLAGQVPDGADATAEWEDTVNALGNCFLLEKNFNISKYDKPLGEWLEELDNFPRDEWSAALDLTPDHVDSGDKSVAQLFTQIAERTRRVKAELVAFVRDDRRLPSAEPISVEGSWTGGYMDKKARVDAPMTLKQDGRRVTGTYGESGKLEGTLDDFTLTGTWIEPKGAGRFSFQFDAAVATFTGSWGKGKVTGGGAWSGARGND